MEKIWSKIFPSDDGQMVSNGLTNLNAVLQRGAKEGAVTLESSQGASFKAKEGGNGL